MIDATGVDLLDEQKAGNLSALIPDRAKLVDVLWFLARGQAEDSGIDQQTFEDSLDADVLSEAMGALAEAYINFCPSQYRQALRDYLDKQIEAMAKAAERMSTEINSPETEAAVNAEIDRMFANAKRRIGKVH